MKVKASISSFYSIVLSDVRPLLLNTLLCIGAILTLLVGMIFSASGCSQPRIQIKDMEIVTKNSHPIRPRRYIIGPGDELEILYQTDAEYSLPNYYIGVEDTLRIEFYYYPGLNKTVIVRPDGIITLHRIGDLKVVGMKSDNLAKKISELYRSYLTKPIVTVEVLEFNARVKELKKAITTAFKGQSRVVIVRPDGMISLPNIKEIQAAGLTCIELSRQIELRYSKFINNIDIVTAILHAKSNRAYIMGAVQRSNYYELLGPTSLTQLIAMAGGFTEQANTRQIVIIRQYPKKQPIAQVIDMDHIIGKGGLRSAPLINQYDVVFIPKSTLSKMALVGRAILSMIPINFNINLDFVEATHMN